MVKSLVSNSLIVSQLSILKVRGLLPKMSTLFVMLFAFYAEVYAQELELSGEEKTQRISEKIMSPYCPGRTLSSCPSDSARKLRREIGTWFEDGYTDEAVESRLIVLFGDQVFGVPDDSRVGLLGWYMPAIAIVFMLFGIFGVLYRMRSVEQDPIDESLVKQAEAEIDAALCK